MADASEAAGAGHEYVVIAGEVEVAVPSTSACMTTYVLKEQGDWFEEELEFCRRMWQPGDRVVDVGANHGVYALSAAKRVGPTGQVWAFEPARAPADCLARSVERNGLGANLHLVRAALSDREGEAPLHAGRDSELSSLSRAEGKHDASETVPLRTLDAVARELGFGDVAFLKLDAEGEEARIVEAGRAFLAGASPLVMFELKHGGQVNAGLVDALVALGYRAYRLVPGLGILVPFSVEHGIEDFQLNLFAARDDRAAALERRGLLAVSTPEVPPEEDASAGRARLLAMSYAGRVAPRWAAATPFGHGRYLVGLSEWARAQETQRSPSERFARLTNAFALVSEAIEQTSNVPRLLSVSRIAFDLGLRTIGLRALDVGLDWPLKLEEPFLLPSPRYETIDPGDRIDAFVTAAALEARETKRAFSSFYTGATAIKDLEALGRLGFLSERMRRRLGLVRERAAAR